MIAYLRGKFVHISEDNLILEVNSIGYNLKIANSMVEFLPSIGEEVKIFTYTYVREDAINLFGFICLDDLEMFKKIITVSGIGPRGALAIMSTLTTDALRFAILTGDAKAISKAPGIGAKTAERMIIDLKDKVSVNDILKQSQENKSNIVDSSFENNVKHQAIEALMALGYQNNEAMKAVKQVEIKESDTVESILKSALKILF